MSAFGTILDSGSKTLQQTQEKLREGVAAIGDYVTNKLDTSPRLGGVPMLSRSLSAPSALPNPLLGPDERCPVAEGVRAHGRILDVPGAVSLRGSRPTNEDAVQEVVVPDVNGDLWVISAVADGHGASAERADTLVREFCFAAEQQLRGEDISDDHPVSDGPPTTPEQAAESMNRWLEYAIDLTDRENTRGGATLVVAVYDMKRAVIHVLTLGDSQALLVDIATGTILKQEFLLWRDLGDSSVRENKEPQLCLTIPHDANSDKELRRYAAAMPGRYVEAAKRPDCLDNENRRLLVIDGDTFTLEPLRSVEPPTHQFFARTDLKPLQRCPEIQSWPAPTTAFLLLLTCDGPFSKNAFPSPQHLARFLVQPEQYVTEVPHTILTDMRISGWLQSVGVDLDTLKGLSFSQWLEKVGERVPRAIDVLWLAAYQPSIQRLQVASTCGSLPSVHTDPWSAMVLAADFAIAHLSDDNITMSATVVSAVQETPIHSAVGSPLPSDQ